MFEVILYQPEIPPNTGNIIRLCANSGSRLHLIEPLGFNLEQRELRRAGLDYADLAVVHVHRDLESCLAALRGATLYAVETAGSRPYSAAQFRRGDALLFGQETRGLPRTCSRGWRGRMCSAFRCGLETGALTCPTPWPWWSTRPGVSWGSLEARRQSNSGRIGRIISPRTTSSAGNPA